MNARVSCQYLSILLLCIQLRFAPSKAGRFELTGWIRSCLGHKDTEPVVTTADFSGVVEYFTPPSSSSSSRHPEVSNPSQAKLDESQEVVKPDAKTNSLMVFGSPSLKQRIINLVEETTAVAGRIKAALAEEVNKLITTQVPMSRSVLDQTMKLSPEKIADIETRTKYYKHELEAEKQIRLTADLFGSVCLGPSEEALGTWMTSPRPRPDFTREKSILEPLEDEINKIIMPCGIFVDLDRGYLAAVPDGIVEKNGIFKIHVLNRPGKDGSRYKWSRGKDLAENKPLYYEIQGLLAITRKFICYLVIVSKDSMQHTIVIRDDHFWQNMLEKLDSFFFNVLAPRLSNDKLPDINDIRLAAGMLHVATSEITDEGIKAKFTKTQKGSFDTLKRQSHTRLLAKDFYVIMNDDKLMKEKVREVRQNYHEPKDEWKSERDFKIAIAKRYANTHDYDFTTGGLIIDKTNRFLAAYPAGIGYRKIKQPQLEQDSRDGQRVQAAQGGKGAKGVKSEKGMKCINFGGSVASLKNAPTRMLKSVSIFARSKSFPKMDKPDAVIFEVITPKELEAGKDLPEMDSAKKGTRNYYKIQGSLAISRAKTCIFMVAYPGKKERVEKIEFNPDFWADMLEELKHFYYSAYLIYHAAPEEFDRMFPGPTLKHLMEWSSEPK